MTTTSKTGKFVAKTARDQENSVTIQRTGSSLFTIGFISQDGEFFLDTEGEQVLIHPEDLKELGELIIARQTILK